MTVLTIVALALAASVPVVRSAPGLSRTPRHAPTPAPLGLVAADASGPDSDRPDPSPPSGWQEDGPGGPGSPAEDSPSREWMAARPARGRAADRPRWAREAAPAHGRPDTSKARPPRRYSVADGPPGLGLSVRLCRLLI